jgi:hypothetical protein
MNGQLDIAKVHTKVVKSVIDTKKQFNATKKGGICQKFQLVFEDGYDAEYCPLVGEFDPNIKAGAKMTFQIVHRGSHGDEITPYFSPTGDPAAPAQFQARPQIPANMHTHPATIALNAAIRYHGEVKQAKEKASLDEILADADTIQEWLIKQTQIDNF